MMSLMLSPILILSFLTLCLISLKEKAADEREKLHNYKAGRISYLIGLGVLVLAVVVQNTKHSVDPWLLAAVIIMIAAKFVSKIYQNIRN